MTTEERGIQEALDASPGNGLLRQVLADHLAELDPPDPRAEGYRALGVLGRVPLYLDRPGVTHPWHFHYFGKWLGADGMSKKPVPAPECGELTGAWVCAIFRRKFRQTAINPQYWTCGEQTRRELEDLAALAWLDLSDADRAEILKAALEATRG